MVGKKLKYLIIVVLAICLILIIGQRAFGSTFNAVYRRQLGSLYGGLLPIGGQATPTPEATYHGYVTRVFTEASGMKMTYYLHIPAGYNPYKKYPLVLLLQGGGERANPKATVSQNRAHLLNAYYTQVWVSSTIQQKWASFVVIPQVVGTNQFVNSPVAQGSYSQTAQPSDSLRMTKEIVDSLQKEYAGIDANRLYITGLSMGGYGTWDAIERWPDYFAAAAPLSGAGDPSKAAVLIHLPIWAFHGTKDTTIPVSGSRDMIYAIEQAGGHPNYTEYPDDAHDLWQPGKVYTPSADPTFFTWFFSQKKS